MSDVCTISLIVAVADNGVIGADNKIPWKCSSDMRYFRAITMGKPVIMGRKTWESLPQPLKGRKNIVLTRNAGFIAKGALVVTSAAKALLVAGEECGEVLIIGGKGVYDEFMPIADRVYFTRIQLSPKGDTFFPQLHQLAEQGWQELSREEKPAGGRDEADMTFIVLEKIKKPSPVQ